MFEFSQLFAPRIGYFELSASSLEYDGNPKVTVLSNGLSTLYGYRKLVPFERFPLLFKAPLGHPEVKVLGRILGLEFDDALDRSGIVFGGSRYGHRLILDAHVPRSYLNVGLCLLSR